MFYVLIATREDTTFNMGKFQNPYATCRKRGYAKGGRSLYSVSVTFGNHFVTFVTFLVTCCLSPSASPLLRQGDISCIALHTIELVRQVEKTGGVGPMCEDHHSGIGIAGA